MAYKSRSSARPALYLTDLRWCSTYRSSGIKQVVVPTAGNAMRGYVWESDILRTIMVKSRNLFALRRCELWNVLMSNEELRRFANSVRKVWRCSNLLLAERATMRTSYASTFQNVLIETSQLLHSPRLSHPSVTTHGSRGATRSLSVGCTARTSNT